MAIKMNFIDIMSLVSTNSHYCIVYCCAKTLCAILIYVFPCYGEQTTQKWKESKFEL